MTYMQMKRTLIRIHAFLNGFGFDPLKTIASFQGTPRFISEYFRFRMLVRREDSCFKKIRVYPCLTDRAMSSGQARGHYFHQDLLIAQRIFHNNPIKHLDVGSRVDGFVAHVASFRAIEVIDIRPLCNNIPNVYFIQSDLMKELDERLLGYCDSISCLHTIEHFGLGRYGDPLDASGHIKGLRNLVSILKPQGKLYLSTPIGPPRIEFNAQRVFSLNYLLGLTKSELRLDRFSFVDDKGDLQDNVTLDEDMVSRNCGCYFGCGIFEFTKLPILAGENR